MSRPGMVVERYAPERQEAWDRFVSTAKNATFLFLRDYMDYHRDRFRDHSLLVTRGQELVAVLPANLGAEDTVHSHEGLTYGGLVVQPDATLRDVLESFREVLAYLRRHSVVRLVLKRLPRHFRLVPDDEIDYVLFLVGAKLFRRDCAMVITRDQRIPFRKLRQREISKARRHGLRLVEENDFGPFWREVLVPRLSERFEVRPVHSLEEIALLASRHPGRIRQFSAYLDDRIVAGTTIYETPVVAHTQYIAVTKEGQGLGALDLLFGWLIDEKFVDKPHFDFGTCNVDEGRGVNQGLLFWKEGFGARTSIHDFYELATGDHGRLDEVLTEVTR